MIHFTITVPASTANIGPGFDSVGMAINRYLTLDVEKNKPWEITQNSPLLPEINHYEDHFIYQVALKTAKRYDIELPSCKINIQSEIPLARGLGSSASAIIAGIELANQICHLSLKKQEKLKIATEFEGHPDNVAPALYGGLVISIQLVTGEIEYIKLPNIHLDAVLYIPEFELKTDVSRDVLPSQYSRQEATLGSGIGNLMIASLLAGNYELAGKMMEQDLFHEPYRKKLIPNYDTIKNEARNFGAYGTVISGAGPTMISFVPKGKAPLLKEQIASKLPDYQVEAVTCDQQGMFITFVA